MSLNNRCNFIGHLGADPEQFTFGDNKKGVKLRLAISESYKDLQGEWQKTTDWLNAVCYRDGLCDYILRSAKKGSKVMLSAKYKRKEYADKDAVVQYSVNFIIEEYTPFEKLQGLEVPTHKPNENKDSEDNPF
jgi:single-strand DNA-binding protein